MIPGVIATEYTFWARSKALLSITSYVR